jgi:hypothetical protein
LLGPELFQGAPFRIQTYRSDSGVAEIIKGKVAVLYHPDQGCGKASLKVYMENNLPGINREWNLLPHQRAGNTKRQYSCATDQGGDVGDQGNGDEKSPDGIAPPDSVNGTTRVYLSKNPIGVGTAHNEEDGKKLFKRIMEQMVPLCTGDNAGRHECDHTPKKTLIDDVASVKNGEIHHGAFALTISQSTFATEDQAKRMLATAIATWNAAVGVSCKDADYETVVQAGDDCADHSPVRREIPPVLGRDGAAMQKRSPFDICRRKDTCGDEDVKPRQCPFKTQLCTAPDGIRKCSLLRCPELSLTGIYPLRSEVEDGDARMMIRLDKVEKHEPFDFLELDCKTIAFALEAMITIVVPEMAVFDLATFPEIELICGEIEEIIETAKDVTNTAKDILGSVKLKVG